MATIRAKWILPVDRPPIENGLISIREGIIESVGAAGLARAHFDFGDALIFPQFVNAHTHLEFSQLPKPLGRPGMAFADWLKLVIDFRQRHSAIAGDHPDTSSPIELGLAESKASAVAGIGEIRSLAGLPSAYRNSELACVVFQERLGLATRSIPSIIEPLGEVVSNPQAWREPVFRGISPHAPYSTHFELVRELVRTAQRFQLPVAMHLAESQEELTLLNSRSGPLRHLLEELDVWTDRAIPSGTRILDYLSLLSTNSRSVVVHGNYLTTEELDFIGAHRGTMSVAYCPRTHGYFGHDPYPLRQLLQRNIEVSIATDSRASNPDLNLTRDIFFAAQQFPEISAAEFLRMSTLYPARAIGLDACLGSISPGKWCRLAYVPAGAGSPPNPERAWLQNVELSKPISWSAVASSQDPL